MIKRTKTMLVATMIGLGIASNQTIANATTLQKSNDGVENNGEVKSNLKENIESRSALQESLFSIDSLNGRTTYNNEDIPVTGWALFKDGGKSLKIYVDNKEVLSGGFNAKRQDVMAVYPQYPGVNQCGFEYKVDKNLVTSGNHTIKVEFTTSTGKTYSKEYTMTMKKADTLMNIDQPSIGTTINNSDIKVRGWGITAAGVQAVRIYCDDVYIANATIGQERQDVAKVYPSYPGVANSGYNYTIDKNKIAPGSRKITVEVVSKDGSTKKQNTTVNVKKPEAKAAIDSVNSSTVIDNKNLSVTGWAINASGVKTVRVYIDNKFLANATTGISRQDVAKVYPSYPGVANSGYNYTVDKSKLSIGTHTLMVEVIGNDGSSNKYSTSFNMKKPSPNMSIDAPSNGSNVNFKDVNVSGWAIDSSDVSSVKVYVNGKYVKDATMGVSRPDVGKIFSSYPNAGKSGYKATIEKRLFNDGNNIIKVVATGKDGTVNSRESTIKYSSPPTRIAIDTPTVNSTVNNQNIIVKGWALDKDGVKEVKVYVDGKYYGTTSTNLSRLDVDKVFPGYPGGKNSGYSYTISKSGIPSGTRTIKVEVVSNNGKVYSQELKFNLKKPASVMSIDTLKDGQVISNNKNFVIEGWGVAADGVEAVRIYSGDTLMGNAKIGISRPDVGKVYPSYSGSSTSGFSYTVPIDYVMPGNKSFKIEVVGKDGSVQSVRRNFTITKPSPNSSIDTINSGSTQMTDNIPVNGWAINASTVKEVKVYLNNTYKGSATLGGSRPDVANAFPNYPGAASSGFNFNISMNGMPIGNYKVKIEVYGKDNSVSTKEVSFNFGGIVTNYNVNNTMDYYINNYYNNATKPQTDASGKWQDATREQTKYYMTPSNFLSGNARYMFLNLNYKDGISAENLNSALSGKGILQGMGAAFLQAGKTNNINPVYLVSHACLETGRGTSTLAKGVSYNGRIVYNMFGIGAVDSDPINGGAKTAYENGWFTPEAAIIGGAKWIGDGYINSSTYMQNTLYKMRWDLVKGWHNYATDIGWAYKQAVMKEVGVADLIAKMNSPVLYFEVPRFK